MRRLFTEKSRQRNRSARSEHVFIEKRTTRVGDGAARSPLSDAPRVSNTRNVHRHGPSPRIRARRDRGVRARLQARGGAGARGARHRAGHYSTRAAATVARPPPGRPQRYASRPVSRQVLRLYPPTPFGREPAGDTPARPPRVPPEAAPRSRNILDELARKLRKNNARFRKFLTNPTLASQPQAGRSSPSSCSYFSSSEALPRRTGTTTSATADEACVARVLSLIHI